MERGTKSNLKHNLEILERELMIVLNFRKKKEKICIEFMQALNFLHK